MRHIKWSCGVLYLQALQASAVAAVYWQNKANHCCHMRYVWVWVFTTKHPGQRIRCNIKNGLQHLRLGWISQLANVFTINCFLFWCKALNNWFFSFYIISSNVCATVTFAKCFVKTLTFNVWSLQRAAFYSGWHAHAYSNPRGLAHLTSRAKVQHSSLREPLYVLTNKMTFQLVSFKSPRCQSYLLDWARPTVSFCFHSLSWAAASIHTS